MVATKLLGKYFQILFNSSKHFVLYKCPVSAKVVLNKCQSSDKEVTKKSPISLKLVHSGAKILQKVCIAKKAKVNMAKMNSKSAYCR